jgi:hypothetical protein
VPFSIPSDVPELLLQAQNRTLAAIATSMASCRECQCKR